MELLKGYVQLQFFPHCDLNRCGEVEEQVKMLEYLDTTSMHNQEILILLYLPVYLDRDRAISVCPVIPFSKLVIAWTNRDSFEVT